MISTMKNDFLFIELNIKYQFKRVKIIEFKSQPLIFVLTDNMTPNPNSTMAKTRSITSQKIDIHFNNNSLLTNVRRTNPFVFINFLIRKRFSCK